MKKNILIFVAALSVAGFLQLATGCIDRKNPFEPFLVPTPSGACSGAGSFGTKYGELQEFTMNPLNMYVCKYAITISVTVSSITLKLGNQMECDAAAAIYDSSGNLIVRSEMIRIKQGWNRLQIAETTLPAGTYGLAVQTYGSDSNVPMYTVDKKDGNDDMYVYSQPVWNREAPFPATLGTLVDTKHIFLLAYADYCPI